MNGCSWTEDLELAKKEISEAFHKVKKEYSVDEKEVIIGGFSSGEIAALEVSLSNAKARGLRGTLLTTEMDPRLSVQKEMVEVFKSAGFPLQFVVTPDIGHWFPEDIETRIDQAIDHIRQK